jgi:hypothetical protein
MRHIMDDFKLIELGEIRFGPRYYNIEINSLLIPDRIFGGEIYRSPDKRYIVLQEWMSIEYSKGPITRPLIIDTLNFTYAIISEGKKGFSSRFDISETILIYHQENTGTGINREFECDLSKLKFEMVYNMKMAMNLR